MGDLVKSSTIQPVLKVFLEGVYDEACILSTLQGLWHILKKIWHIVLNYWRENLIDTKSVRDKVVFEKGDILSYLNLSQPTNFKVFPFISIKTNWNSATLTFPKPKNINVNMMPFVFGRDFKDCKLPDYIKDYWPIIKKCQLLDPVQCDKICYLTIQESKVDKGLSQRRPGLHVERPGRIALRGNDLETNRNGKGSSVIINNQYYHHWGMGMMIYGDQPRRDRFEIRDGIYMASTVESSCKIWDCQILDDNLIGTLGDLEHIRSVLPPGCENMRANCLYWLTDRTPHESLPLENSMYRQYFRLVTHKVSLWFEDHSSKNPCGVLPDPQFTKIVKGSKFKPGEAYIVNDV